MTAKEYSVYMTNNRAYRITYRSGYSTGTIEIDTLLYQKRINKFRSKFKDCEIIKFEEVEKPKDHEEEKTYTRGEYTFTRTVSGRYL